MSFLSVNGDASAGFSNYSFGQDSNGYYITGTVMYNTKAGEVNSHTTGKTYLGSSTSGFSASLLSAYNAFTNPVTSPASPVTAPTIADTSSNDSAYTAPSVASASDSSTGSSLLSGVANTLSAGATQTDAASNDATYVAPTGIDTTDTGASNKLATDTTPGSTILTQTQNPAASDPTLNGPSSGGTNETPPSAQSINNEVNRNLARDGQGTGIAPVNSGPIPLGQTTTTSNSPASTLQSMGLQQSYIAQDKQKFGLLDLISGGQRTAGPATESTSLLGK